MKGLKRKALQRVATNRAVYLHCVAAYWISFDLEFLLFILGQLYFATHKVRPQAARKRWASYLNFFFLTIILCIYLFIYIFFIYFLSQSYCIPGSSTQWYCPSFALWNRGVNQPCCVWLLIRCCLHRRGIIIVSWWAESSRCQSTEEGADSRRVGWHFLLLLSVPVSYLLLTILS